MRLLRIRWPEMWTSGWSETIHVGNMAGFPRLPFDLQVTLGDETRIVTAVARRRSGELVCKVRS